MKKKPLFYPTVLLIMLGSVSLFGLGAGDVNLDNSVTIVDALMVAQYYVGLSPASFNVPNGDANGNGSVDITDALLIARFYVGLIPNFPIYNYPLDSKYMVIPVPVIDENS